VSNSLRRRLLWLLLAAVCTLWLLTAGFSFLAARHEIDELFDAQLAQSAQVIMTQARLRAGQVTGEVEKFGNIYEQKLAFQIWDGEGRLLLRTSNAPPGRMADSESGFSNTEIEETEWRVFSRRDPQTRILVQVGQSDAIRNELAFDIVLILLAPMLLAFPVLALLIWASLGRGLAPLARAADQVASRAPGNLTPIDTAETPTEIRPLLGALNDLLRRLGDALDGERRFTADAAHELRTPLAALKTHSQVALRADSDAERLRALEQVITGVDRATQLVHQLLTLARVDPECARQEGTKLDLPALARGVLADLGPAAVTRGVELTLEAAPGGNVRGDPTMLGVLVHNLVDNAIRYTPSGGAVVVRAGSEAGMPSLEVEDTGPGIPIAEREMVFGRFYRILGSGVPGSGLGLSIVKRIAELHRAEVSLHEGRGGRGLLVRVRFSAQPV
jgi:two-component system, OmpR family, sensor kinase